MSPTTPNTKQELHKLLERYRAATVGLPSDASVQDVEEEIEQLLTDTVNKTLDELESKKATYQDCDTGEHNWGDCTCDTEDAVSLSAIEQVRKRFNDE